MDPDVTIVKTGHAYPEQQLLKQDITVKAVISGDEDKAVGQLTVECDEIRGSSRPQRILCGTP